MILWTNLPDAQRLIAAAVANPPPQHGFRYSDRVDVRYTGPIARELRRIHERFTDELMLRRGEVSDADITRNMALTPTKAIDAAREAAGVAQVDEGFWLEAAE
jgi:hypothetical protein